jgi:hypothetical protein
MATERCFYTFDAELCEHFPVTSEQLAILDEIEKAGGRIDAGKILTSDSRRQSIGELEENYFVRKYGEPFRPVEGVEIGINGRAVLKTQREWLEHVEVQMLLIKTEDFLAGKRRERAKSVAGKPVASEPPVIPVVRTFGEWQELLSWSQTTWSRRRKDFAACFTDVPGENACSIREPELSLWLASAENKNRSPFEKP